tara:strand:- start:61 stop:558 length:498 start_codon:yes stop_codon:yes gene_type:complete
MPGKNGKGKEKVKKVVKKVVNAPGNLRANLQQLRMEGKGSTKQEGGKTTTTKEYAFKGKNKGLRGGSNMGYTSYDWRPGVGDSGKKVIKTKTISPTNDYGKYTLTKKKESFPYQTSSGSDFGDATKSKTKTKTISQNRAARIINRGTRRQSNWRTVRNAIQGNKG